MSFDSRVGSCLVLLLAAGVTVLPVRAQDTTQVLDDLGVHRDTIDTFQPQPYPLQPFVLPGTESIRVGATTLDTSEYEIDYRAGDLWVHRDDLIGARDTLFARYRTYPFSFDDVYRRRRPDSTVGADSAAVTVVEEDGPGVSRFDPFEGIDIQRSGSISRGFVGGTNRDVTPESGLRLQLQGEVADSVFVRALLTDENTPIQPEGTTQRLQDFDRVYLEVDAPVGAARLGDVDVDLDGAAFGQFTQKVQGAVVSSKALGTADSPVGGEATAFGAVSRGQYRTQDIEPMDGVQGPYRLRGKNGEEAIIVIAGSERVFLDGTRLTRGRTEDYVIDYTQADITFTAENLITDDRRITVEFQYSTTQFTRTLAGGQATVGAWRGMDGEPRLDVGATVIRQADGRNFQTAFDLSRRDSVQLVEAGDEEAVRSGARRVEFYPEAPYVHYGREPVTTPDGGRDTVFVPLDAAPAEDRSVYRVRFTRVGEGSGRYKRVGRNVNGVVYEYAGAGDGSYEPIQPLPAPVRQRLVDLTGSVEPVRGLELFGEWAHSANDENRFSPLDAANDRGQAYAVGARVAPSSLAVGSTSLGTVSGEVRRRRRGQHFVTFGQTRPIEYGRRWNLSRSGSDLPVALRDRGGETEDRGHLAVNWGEGSGLEVGGGRLAVGSAFEAWRRRGELSLREEGWPRLSLRREVVTSRNRAGQIDGRWLRQDGTVRQPLFDGALTPRFEVEHEGRRQRAFGTDSLTEDSFRFLELRPGVTYKGGPLRATGSVEYRSEDGAARGRFREASTAWTAQTEVAYDPSAPYEVSATGGYRRRRVRDYFRVQEQRRGTESAIVQLEGRAEPLDRAITARMFYDAATERTPILQELYVETRPEIGQYVWRDHNDDGLQQIDEFVPETTPNEGTYVRRFVPSDTLESVVDLQARTRLTLRPRRLWQDSDLWWKQGLSRVTSETRIEVQEKSRTETPSDIYRFKFDHFRRPGQTIDGSLRMEQRLALFRTQRDYGVDLSWRQVRGLTERASGAERSFLNRWQVEGQVHPASNWGLRVEAAASRDRVRSEAFAQARSYDIRTLSVHPGVSYSPGRTMDLSLTGVVSRKRDRAGGRETEIYRLPVELTWRRAGRLRLTADAEVARVDLTGAAVGRANFELTEGRGAGTSFLWALQGQYAFHQNLRATVNYHGRSPASAPVIHTVRIQVSASF